MRRTVSAALVWLVVVALGSLTVWWVIGRVGDGIGSPTVAESTLPPAPRNPVDRTPKSAGDSTLKPTSTPTNPATPTPSSSSSSPSTASTPSGTPTPAPTSGQTSGQTSGHPTNSPSPTTPAPSQEHTGAWHQAAGLVTVSCRGHTITLTGASPSPGWEIGIGSRGPEQVEVEFEQHERDGKVHVRSRCVAGAPVFTASQETERDD